MTRHATHRQHEIPRPPLGGDEGSRGDVPCVRRIARKKATSRVNVRGECSTYTVYKSQTCYILYIKCWYVVATYHIMHMPLRSAACPCRPHLESNPSPSPECAAAFTTRPPRPILLRLTPTEHLWYGDNNTLVRAKRNARHIFHALAHRRDNRFHHVSARCVCRAETHFFIFSIFYFHVFWVQVHTSGRHGGGPGQ